jgi:hypothetical protein
MRHFRSWRGLVLAVATVAAAAACTNPVSPGNHQVAMGVVIRDGSQELVRAAGTTVTGALSVQAGQQKGPLTVRFLDHAGAEFEPRSGYWLRVDSSNPAVAQWQQAVEGEHGGRLVGVSAGQATLTFYNMHGAVGRGHDDGLQAVTVVVTDTP